MANFETAIPLILKYEGSNYTDIAEDAGGATKYGISLNFAKSVDNQAMVDMDGNGVVDKEDIKNMTEDAARELYKMYFWDVFGLDYIKSNRKALMIFDAAVNHGNKAATRITQRALQYLGCKITVDGIYGNSTKGFLMKVNSDKFVDAFLLKRTEFYNSIVKNNPSQEKFLKGWLNRIKWIKQDASKIEDVEQMD